ncbi:MAG TPA: hypothetical protein VM290_04735 [Gaiellaceae bacterium]|nr:hypothetical protein [Gaiellaceae bacterium]
MPRRSKRQPKPYPTKPGEKGVFILWKPTVPPAEEPPADRPPEREPERR